MYGTNETPPRDKFPIIFTACEKSDDLEKYKEDIVASGGMILHDIPNFSESKLNVLVLAYKDDFMDKFTVTDSYQYSSLFGE